MEARSCRCLDGRSARRCESGRRPCQPSSPDPIVNVRLGFNPRTEARAQPRARPWCGAARRATPSRPAPHRSRGASGSRSSRARSTRRLALGQVLDRLREAVLDLGGVERSASGSSVLVLDRVEEGDLAAALRRPANIHSSSRARTEEFAICSRASWKLIHGHPEAPPPSPRPWAPRRSSCLELEFASSMSRARERTERGTQSSERSSSMIAP